MTETSDPAQMSELLKRHAARVQNLPDLQALDIEGLVRLSGGASQQIWRFTLATPRGRTELILRRAPQAHPRGPGDLHAGLATEALLLGCAASWGVPVPKVWSTLTPDEGLGEGFIMEYIEGETLGGRIVREATLAHARTVLAGQCGAAMAAIHRIPLEQLPPLRQSSASAEVQSYWESYRRSGERKPVFELAFAWLRAHMPPPLERAVLVHGDFRNGNIMVGPQGLLALLDWELAHLGDPMEDLGWICVNSWRFGGSMPVGGFGSLEDLFAGYEAGGARVDRERVRFWVVLGTLKWGVMCETMSIAPAGHPLAVERAVIGRRSSESEFDLLTLLAPLGGGP